MCACKICDFTCWWNCHWCQHGHDVIDATAQLMMYHCPCQSYSPPKMSMIILVTVQQDHCSFSIFNTIVHISKHKHCPLFTVQLQKDTIHCSLYQCNCFLFTNEVPLSKCSPRKYHYKDIINQVMLLLSKKGSSSFSRPSVQSSRALTSTSTNSLYSSSKR